MAWIYLIAGGIFECGWAVGLKYTEGFTKLVPSILTLVSMGLSFWGLSVAMKTIPVGTAYAVWTGIGAVGVAVIGMIFLGESKEFLRIVSIFFIIAGIIGLKLFSGHHAAG